MNREKQIVINSSSFIEGGVPLSAPHLLLLLILHSKDFSNCARDLLGQLVYIPHVAAVITAFAEALRSITGLCKTNHVAENIRFVSSRTKILLQLGRRVCRIPFNVFPSNYFFAKAKPLGLDHRFEPVLKHPFNVPGRIRTMARNAPVPRQDAKITYEVFLSTGVNNSFGDMKQIPGSN